MTIFRSRPLRASAAALALLAFSSPAAAANPPATKPRTEIERLVLEGDSAAQNAIKDWIVRHQEQPQLIEKEMGASGFERVSSSSNCLSFVYSGEAENTLKDRMASLVICPKKEPVVLLLRTIEPRTDSPSNWPRIKTVPPTKGKQ